MKNGSFFKNLVDKAKGKLRNPDEGKKLIETEEPAGISDSPFQPKKPAAEVQSSGYNESVIDALNRMPT